MSLLMRDKAICQNQYGFPNKVFDAEVNISIWNFITVANEMFKNIKFGMPYLLKF